MRQVRFLFGLALLALAASCGSTAAPAARAPASAVEPSSLKAAGEAQVGDRTKCPVSGEEFVVREDSPKAEYQGKTYYFCCKDCPTEFKADPQKYLGKPGA